MKKNNCDAIEAERWEDIEDRIKSLTVAEYREFILNKTNAILIDMLKGTQKEIKELKEGLR